MAQPKFNASISTLGIKEPKVQQAIMKLLENSLYHNSKLSRVSDNLRDENRLLRQRLSELEAKVSGIINLES